MKYVPLGDYQFDMMPKLRYTVAVSSKTTLQSAEIF